MTTPEDCRVKSTEGGGVAEGGVEVWLTVEPMDEMERNLFAIEKELSVHRTIQDSSVLEPFWRGGGGGGGGGKFIQS